MTSLLAAADLRDVIAANVWLLVPAMVFGFLTLGAIVDAARKVMQTRAREGTRREIAAYVAEGSMTPEDAERILAANGKSGSRKGGCW